MGFATGYPCLVKRNKHKVHIKEKSVKLYIINKIDMLYTKAITKLSQKLAQL